MSEIDDPWHSRPIDVHRWSDHPEVKGLTKKVWGEAGLDSLVGTTGPKPKRPFREQLRVGTVCLKNDIMGIYCFHHGSRHIM